MGVPVPPVTRSPLTCSWPSAFRKTRPTPRFVSPLDIPPPRMTLRGRFPSSKIPSRASVKSIRCGRRRYEGSRHPRMFATGRIRPSADLWLSRIQRRWILEIYVKDTGSPITNFGDDEIKNMYNKIVLDHFHDPKNLREMKNADSAGMGASQVCGDIMTLFLKLKGDKIEDASFTTMGCSVAIASGSILTDMLKGKTLN